MNKSKNKFENKCLEIKQKFKCGIEEHENRGCPKDQNSLSVALKRSKKEQNELDDLLVWLILPHSDLWEKPVGWSRVGTIFTHPATRPNT